jgi:hypothetical protein
MHQLTQIMQSRRPICQMGCNLRINAELIGGCYGCNVVLILNRLHFQFSPIWHNLRVLIYSIIGIKHCIVIFKLV